MAIDFSTITLNVIDITTNTSPDIFINSSGISFSKKVLEDLNFPANVQFCTDSVHRVFAIRPCRSCDAKAVSFVKPNTKPGTTLCISNRNLKECITALAPELDPTIRYKISGEFDREHRIMYFDLTQVSVCEIQPPKKDK